jgi:hypothetical protein
MSRPCSDSTVTEKSREKQFAVIKRGSDNSSFPFKATKYKNIPRLLPPQITQLQNYMLLNSNHTTIHYLELSRVVAMPPLKRTCR